MSLEDSFSLLSLEDVKASYAIKKDDHYSSELGRTVDAFYLYFTLYHRWPNGRITNTSYSYITSGDYGRKIMKDFPTYYSRIIATASYSLDQALANNTDPNYLLFALQEAKPGLEKIANFIVPKGQMTFEEEGEEGGPLHSRTPSVPDNNSGVTIGRGYDCKEKPPSEIYEDLTSIGLNHVDATEYSLAGKMKNRTPPGPEELKGKDARNFIKDHSLIEITPAQQKALFVLTYNKLEADVIRICNKPEVVALYGQTDWSNTHPAIREVVIDLRFRGDYSGLDDTSPPGGTRALIQKHIAKNDLAAFTAVLSDRKIWVEQQGVPEKRFYRRIRHLTNAINNSNRFFLENETNSISKFFAVSNPEKERLQIKMPYRLIAKL